MIAAYIIASLILVLFTIKEVTETLNVFDILYQYLSKYIDMEEEYFRKQYNKAMCLLLLFSPVLAPLIILHKLLNYFRK